MDSSERTPTAQFTYETTPTNVTTLDPTTTKVRSNTAYADITSLPTDTYVPPPDEDPSTHGTTTAPEMTNETGPTPQVASDKRSDIFLDISAAPPKPPPERYPQTDDGFNMGLDLGLDLDLDLDLGMLVDYQYDPTADDTYSANSDTLLARKTESFDFVLEVDHEEAKEETEVTEESTPTMLDRMPYFEKFMDAMVEYGAVKRLNNFLHKKMADYFKKRKMDHVLEEAPHPDEAIIKYGKKLDNYASLQEIDVVQKRELTTEVTLLRDVKEKQCNRAETAFQNLLNHEIEIGVGLISSKTGKEISEKTIDRLISAQITKSDELRDLRLLHITIRNAVTYKNNEIKAMDKIGENYTLIEFEQMKIENQSNLDKIEERDDELMRLRKKCTNAIQSLAHVREKCSASEQNITILKETLHEKEKAKTVIREQMNQLKQERDFYRLETQRLKDENGLLTKDRLLIDMENAMQAIEDLEKLNQSKRDKLRAGKERLHNLRMHYEGELKRRINMGRMRVEFILAEPSEVVTRKVRPKKPNKYLGERPSIIKPDINCYQRLISRSDSVFKQQ
ncbi:coiled-coil domain-containing protein 96-like [Atheta coriaria]|uniref:coiled-coil domain-containing protein 96-like n=1 Tax=Dalotia coriaria TaxID=877792 RepID=UPI0031F3D084